MENRNITSELQNFSTQEIKEKLIAQSFPYAILMEHWRGDYNFSVAIRNANAFGAREVFYLGRKQFDPRRAVGTHHYTEVNYLSDFEQVSLKLKATSLKLMAAFKSLSKVLPQFRKIK